MKAAHAMLLAGLIAALASACLFATAVPAPQAEQSARVTVCGYRWKRLLCKSRYYDQVADFRWKCKLKKSRYGCPSAASASRFADTWEQEAYT